MSACTTNPNSWLDAGDVAPSSECGPPSVFRPVCDLLLGTKTMAEVLHELAVAALVGVPWAACATVSMIVEVSTTAAGFTDPRAAELYTIERNHGRGPAGEAFRHGQPVLVMTTTADTPFPEYTEAARKRGLYSTLSVPLTASTQRVGSLTWHATHGDALAAAARSAAETVGHDAGLAVASMRSYQSLVVLNEQLSAAMRSRERINLARGILMNRTGCSASGAWQQLVEHGERSGVDPDHAAGTFVACAERAAHNNHTTTLTARAVGS